MSALQGVRFSIWDWIASGPGLDLHSDPEKTPATLPPNLRRRISEIGQSAFRASLALSEQRGARFVFCSRYGEMDRTLRILHSLCSADPVSPADFSLSVHNALAGLLSIAWRNTEGHTAISAGEETFGYGLLEATTCLRQGSEDGVMLVYFDDVLTPPYDEFADGTEPSVALAMLLKTPRNDGRDFMFTLQHRDPAIPVSHAISQPLAFLKFMADEERELTWSSEQTVWRWHRGD